MNGKIISESRVLSKMADYCSKAERSEFDVRTKLQNSGLDNETIDRIINRLIKENFINNERYCKSFINDKMRINKWGKTKITYELKKKRIPESIIHTCFEDIENPEFEEILLAVLKTKMKTIKAANNYEKRIKLIRFSLSRGYSMELSRKCVSKLLNDSDDEYTESFF